MNSPDKSGEDLEKEFCMVKHIDLSPNFFYASLLIVDFSMSQIKYKIFNLSAFDPYPFLFPF
jgi:hypothetical protein